MNTIKLSIYIAALFLMATLVSCRNSENNYPYCDRDESEECSPENPIDSIIHITDEEIRCHEVYKYLITHPEFINLSDSIGYHSYSCDDCERCVLWKDCGIIRVYSIPCPLMYASYSYNIIQFRDKGSIDTTFLQDNIGQLDKLYEIRNKKGNVYYVLKTNAYAIRHGDVIEEYISAFSIKDGHLMKEKLFHANGRQYDVIEVVCGEERHPPLDYNSVILISLKHFDDGEGVPAFVIAEINNNDWPTGYGLKYQWNGDWFEYVGKCQYNVDDYFQ